MVNKTPKAVCFGRFRLRWFGLVIPTKAINWLFLLVKIANSGVKGFVGRTTIYGNLCFALSDFSGAIF
ncbi:hypothetical protein ST37_17115 [Vibrio sp. qd031]|nr:hypothetical protein ST37_17115 [Vibrio sp. qd031]